MARGLTYRDAAVLLGGGPETRVVAALDKVFGGALLVATAFDPGFALSLFDAKSELCRLSTELIGGLGERVRGLTRHDRTRRLEAANAVAVTAAFFECVDEIDLPRELRPTKAEQVAIASNSSPAHTLTRAVLTTPAPLPAAHVSPEETRDALIKSYGALTGRLSEFLHGLAAWDQLPYARQQSTRAELRSIPDRAVARYEATFRRLALEFPEFGYWANQLDHRATRTRIDIAFTGLGIALDRMRVGRDPERIRRDLAMTYRAVLTRPGPEFGELRVPPTGRCYVNPNFRVGQPRLDEITSGDWWYRQTLRTDLQDFLVGHLTSPLATEAPLVVLGHPGAGKSMLTQMLAARLPDSDFLTVRVPLRDVPADADLQTQLELTVRADTGSDTTWPQLVDTAGDALPVVLLDGFDELLQATGQSQSDYLERVATFQQREADLGRPVAVVVTSRLTVADRARPVSGMVTLLLEPFDDNQIALWLDAWHEGNAAALAARGVRPLPPETALRYEDLARQPLLLLLLALYDSDANALHDAERLHEAELYERLLTAFTRREVRKAGESLTEAELDQAVAREMLHLSVVAFAMFNRNQLWVADGELDADLRALIDRPTAAGLLVGRFYFVYAAQANNDRKRLRTYEFLHATFGEFLVARLVVQELDNLVAANEVPTTPGRPRPVDDRFLHALLSFTALTMRLTVLDFIAAMIDSRATDARITQLLLGLFHAAQLPRDLPALDDYRPARLSVPVRVAAYSANLFILAALSAGELTSAELFPDATDHAIEWTRTAQLWRSQLPTEGWNTLITAFTARREWDDGIRVMRLGAQAAPVERPIDPYWSYNMPPQPWQHWSAFIHDNGLTLRAEVEFAGGLLQEVGLHNLEPFAGELGTMLMTFHDMRGRQTVSAARALVELWLASGRSVAPAALADEYETCLRIAVNGFAPDDDRTRRVFRDIVVRQLKCDLGRLPRGWLPATAQVIRSETDAANADARAFLEELQQLDHPA